MNHLCFILLTTISLPVNIQQVRQNMLVNAASIVEVISGPGLCKDGRMMITNEGNEKGSWCVLETLNEINEKINACK